jgi:serine/threonine-protein kinase
MSTSQIDRLKAALPDRYTIERELGEGGMATVYLARDLKHKRAVALKVLRPELAAAVGAERFLAEIETTAKLHHPRILPLFDSGTADSFLFYVMPHVDGETLRERIERQGQLPVDEAIRIATAVAAALQHAHDKGVIHRDIKPANILLQDGEPLVADFGVALALRAADSMRLTETGVSVGTPHYMSPEQATGGLIGPTTDVYALGCVLYEMLAGEPPYVASTPQGVLGKIIQGRATPITEVRPSVPLNVDAAVRRALEKVPADRFARVEDFANALANPAFRHGRATERQAGHSRWAVGGLAAAVVVLTGLAAWGWSGRLAPAPPVPVTRLTATLPPDHRVALPEFNVFPLALSADGRTLAYVGESAAGTLLYVRSLDSYQARALEGTRGATQPFFSPDGSWLAYFAGGRLHRVSVDGGAPIPVAFVDGVPAGGAWGPDDLIVFAKDSTLWRIGVSGGEPERVPWESPALVGWPSFLPAGSGGWTASAVLVSSGNELYAVSVEDGEARALDVTTNGHAIFSRGFLVSSETSGVVRAVPFDHEAFRVTGTAVSVLDDVLRPNLTDATVLRISESGTLAYMPGTSARRLVLVDRAGRATELPFRRGAYRTVAVSPDGARLLTERRGEGTLLMDIAGGTENAVPGNGTGLAWSPTGLEYVGNLIGGGLGRFVASPASRTPTREYPGNGFSSNWGSDDIVVLFTADQRAANRGGLLALRIDGDAPAETLLDTEADERFVSRSPDGRWIAYMSDVSGEREIYVRLFAGGESRLVSVNGGDRPVFSRDGRELFYLAGERMYAVPTARLDQSGPLAPELLFTGSYVALSQSWDVRPQGDFVMVSAGPSWLREILVVQNWTTELEGLFASGGR